MAGDRRAGALASARAKSRWRSSRSANRNALKHGARSAETLALKRQITALARMARETLARSNSVMRRFTETVTPNGYWAVREALCAPVIFLVARKLNGGPFDISDTNHARLVCIQTAASGRRASMSSYSSLLGAVTSHAAIRRRRRLQPAGGPGDKLFPPTYPGEGNSPPRHVFERRRIGGQDVTCVLIDSVQSQANRLEEALLEAAKDGTIRLPRVVVDFPGAGLNSVPEISSLEAPHRIFDAILRDSNLDGEDFRKSPVGVRLVKAKADDATAILEISPTALLFGAWNSTGEGGGVGAKFARAIVSEIVGIDASVGRRAGVRIDPLGILSSIRIKGGPNDWELAKDGEKGAKPSEVNHSNVIAGAGKGEKRQAIWEQGITCDYAEHIAVVTLAGLRRLRFGDGSAKNAAARAYLAALGLVALLEQDARGYALRSRCDLVCDGPAPLELVGFDGAAETIGLDLAAARSLHEEAFDKAKAAGFEFSAEPIRLTPMDKLVQLVHKSQNKALQDEGGEPEGD